MNSTTARGCRVALASLAFAGLYYGTAGADDVHGSGRVGVGLPANSGSLLYEDGGGIRSNPRMSSSVSPIQAGLPANSGSLLYEDGGGIRSKPRMSSGVGPIQVGLPANSGSLLYQDGGGIRSQPRMSSEPEQPTASLQQESTFSNEH